ncbi:MAG: hypothetical protein ISS23_01525 [Nanoarchaeota archaeon]|nr:hypothetical protein [Nanoarchaeota archaeon]
MKVLSIFALSTAILTILNFGIVKKVEAEEVKGKVESVEQIKIPVILKKSDYYFTGTLKEGTFQVDYSVHLVRIKSDKNDTKKVLIPAPSGYKPKDLFSRDCKHINEISYTKLIEILKPDTEKGVYIDTYYNATSIQNGKISDIDYICK